MHACLLWHMAANWTVTLLSCVHCAFGTHGLKQPPENVSGVCLQLTRPGSKKCIGFADDSRTFRQGRGCGHMTLACGTSSFVNLWDSPLRTCACLHNLASSDHQENYRIGVSYWNMICNSNYAKIQLGFLTYHGDAFFTRVLFCLGESCPPKEDRKPGWTENLWHPLFH